jgi:hypothetical protein
MFRVPVSAVGYPVIDGTVVSLCDIAGNPGPSTNIYWNGVPATQKIEVFPSWYKLGSPFSTLAGALYYSGRLVNKMYLRLVGNYKTGAGNFTLNTLLVSGLPTPLVLTSPIVIISTADFATLNLGSTTFFNDPTWTGWQIACSIGFGFSDSIVPVGPAYYGPSYVSVGLSVNNYP